jgi:2-keto-4-pentenoate hydratase/2-oxohepta-3-ene-1,7-dioic acid hydratase in catechol pathway
VRLATIIPENRAEPVAAVSVTPHEWVGLYSFLTFFATSGLPEERAPLESFLPILLPRFSEFTRKVNDWPEHGRVFRKRGGRSFSARKFLPPVLRPSTFRDFYGFEQHVRVSRERRGLEMIQAWYEIPVFYFSNPNSLVGNDAEISVPRNCAELDYELELGVIIGRRGRDINPSEAWNYVAGFTIVNDFSARDLQRAEMPVGLGPAKGKDFATAAGPVLVTRDEFTDKIDKERISLDMRARLNGRQISWGNSSTLFHSLPAMIARASCDADLYPGDLIGSGTIGTGCILELGPENTGGWLKAGDVVELEIERVGTLRTKIKSDHPQ